MAFIEPVVPLIHPRTVLLNAESRELRNLERLVPCAMAFRVMTI